MEILTEKEKAYLAAVLQPYGDRVDTISKQRSSGCEYLLIEVWEIPDFREELPGLIELPAFKPGQYYAGMELGRQYKPKELGLW